MSEWARNPVSAEGDHEEPWGVKEPHAQEEKEIWYETVFGYVFWYTLSITHVLNCLYTCRYTSFTLDGLNINCIFWKE